VYKIAESAVQSANCIVLHAYLRTAVVPIVVQAPKNFIQLIYLTKRPHSIFD